MSKLPIAGVVVTVLFNVIVAAAPNITDEHKRAIFVYAIPLFILACIWWAWEFFRTHKAPPQQPQHSTSASGVSGSNVATAGRDVYQNIYHATPPPEPTPPSGPALSLDVLTGAAPVEVEVAQPDFFYDGAGSQIVVRPVIPPGRKNSVALIQFRLQFVNGGRATAYDVAAKVYGCWIYDEPTRALLIDSATSVGRTAPGQRQSLLITSTRQWDKPPFNTLDTRKNHLTIRVEISFRSGSSAGPTHENEPIWLTWNPATRNSMSPSTVDDVAIAEPAIGRIRQVSINRAEREPQSVFVALDELKEMEHEGQEMLDRMFLHGDFPTLPKLGDFLSRTLAAARQKVFAPRVTAKELGRFKKDWDEEELLKQKAMLYDAGFLKDDSPDSNKLGTVDLLYSRVQRLKELIAFIEDDSATLPPL